MDRGGLSNHRRTDRGGRARVRFATVRPRHDAPAVAYTSTEILAWERRHMFAGSWECLGRDEDLRQAGDGRPVTQRGLHAGDVRCC